MDELRQQIWKIMWPMVTRPRPWPKMSHWPDVVQTKSLYFHRWKCMMRQWYAGRWVLAHHLNRWRGWIPHITLDSLHHMHWIALKCDIGTLFVWIDGFLKLLPWSHLPLIADYISNQPIGICNVCYAKTAQKRWWSCEYVSFFYLILRQLSEYFHANLSLK